MGKVVKKILDTAVAVVDFVGTTVVTVLDTVVDVAEAVVTVAVNIVVTVVEVVWDVVVTVWEDVAMPILEEVFSWIGIEDETLVQVDKVSSKILGDSDPLEVKKAKARAVMTWLKEDNSFWKVVAREIVLNKTQINGYYRFAEAGNYLYDLPDMNIIAGSLDKDAVKAAIDSEIPVNIALISANAMFPSGDIWYKNEYQEAPYNFKPTSNVLSHPDEWDNWHDDWTWESTTLNLDPAGYTIRLSRVAERALFWIEGPRTITEGGTVTLTVRCNRVLPVGSSVTVNLDYAGSIDPLQYVPVASVTFAESTDVVTFDVVISEDVTIEATETLVVSLGAIENNGAFEAVDTSADDTHTITVIDNDTLSLVMDSTIVNEADTSVTIPVTLTGAASGAFTVDYSFVDETTVGGVDYDNTPGQLSFAGTANEVQNIVVPLTPDIVEGSKETFKIVLSNLSITGVDISTEAFVTITDSVVGAPAQDTTTYFLDITKPDSPTTRHIIAQYERADDPGEYYYWIYNPKTGVYPAINADSAALQTNQMLPIAILRSDKVSVTVDKNSEWYRTTKNLTARLGMPLDKMVEGIEASKNGDGESNIDQINDAYINFAVCPSDNSHALSKILWFTFYEIIVTNGLQSANNKYFATMEEQEVNQTLVWYDQSYEEDLSGTKAEVGEYSHIIDTNQPTSLEIYYQKSAGLYDKIRITSLSGATFIDYQTHHESVFLSLTDDKFTIPVSWYAFRQLSNEEVLSCFKDILRCDIYALVVTEIEWYQTEDFAEFMKVVGIFMTIITLGTTGSFWAAVGMLVSQYLVIQLVIYIAEVTGNEVLAAVVGIVAMIALGATFGLPPIDFTTADGLVKIVSDFATIYSAAGSQVLQDLGEELEVLTEEYEESKELYDTASDSLISAEDTAYLRSVDTNMVMAIGIQYEFDAALGGNYDRLISDYYDNLLKLGVI